VRLSLDGNEILVVVVRSCSSAPVSGRARASGSRTGVIASTPLRTQIVLNAILLGVKDGSLCLPSLESSSQVVRDWVN